LVFHNQANDISADIIALDNLVKQLDISGRAIHTAPLIRRESDYMYFDISIRRKIFNNIFDFARKIKFTYTVLLVEKKQVADPIDIVAKLSKQLFRFINDNIHAFSIFDKTIVYYDNGQIDLTKVLVSVFSTSLNNVEFRKAFPVDYKLFQVADLLCTTELLSLKLQRKSLSKSEKSFFPSVKKLRKIYISKMKDKMFDGDFD
jgi:hypothetical protein